MYWLHGGSVVETSGPDEGEACKAPCREKAKAKDVKMKGSSTRCWRQTHLRRTLGCGLFNEPAVELFAGRILAGYSPRQEGYFRKCLAEWTVSRLLVVLLSGDTHDVA